MYVWLFLFVIFVFFVLFLFFISLLLFGLDGLIVCEENEQILSDAWHQEQQKKEKEMQKKKEQRAVKNWRKLVKALLLKDYVKEKYETDSTTITSSSR
jgi:hypothetical protein